MMNRRMCSNQLMMSMSGMLVSMIGRQQVSQCLFSSSHCHMCMHQWMCLMYDVGMVDMIDSRQLMMSRWGMLHHMIDKLQGYLLMFSNSQCCTHICLWQCSMCDGDCHCHMIGSNYLMMHMLCRWDCKIGRQQGYQQMFNSSHCYINIDDQLY